MATLQDVAELAGVAPITVSRVLNNSGYVSQTTRERVEAAAAELHYVPNMLASSLRSNRTNFLALILTDITNPFWTTVARGVEDAASNQEYSVVLCNTDENESKQEKYLKALLRKRVDGFLLTPTSSTPTPVHTIQRQGVPVVVLDRRVPGIEVDVVRGASRRGAYDLAKYLLDLHHRHIAVITGPQNVSTAQERVSGFRRALDDAGVMFDEANLLYGEYTAESGYRLAQSVLSMNPRPTALFTTNNFIAAGALRALRENQVRVPEDISVVTFDEQTTQWQEEPFLTSAVQPAYDIGFRATELLLDRINLPDDETFREIALPCELVIRQSCRSIHDD